MLIRATARQISAAMRIGRRRTRSSQPPPEREQEERQHFDRGEQRDLEDSCLQHREGDVRHGDKGDLAAEDAHRGGGPELAEVTVSPERRPNYA